MSGTRWFFVFLFSFLVLAAVTSLFREQAITPTSRELHPWNKPPQQVARNCQKNEVDCMTDVVGGCEGGCSISMRNCVDMCKGCYINR